MRWLFGPAHPFWFGLAWVAVAFDGGGQGCEACAYEGE